MSTLETKRRANDLGERETFKKRKTMKGWAEGDSRRWSEEEEEDRERILSEYWKWNKTQKTGPNATYVMGREVWETVRGGVQKCDNSGEAEGYGKDARLHKG